MTNRTDIQGGRKPRFTDIQGGRSIKVAASILSIAFALSVIVLPVIIRYTEIHGGG